MITYRGVSSQLLSSSYGKEIEVKKDWGKRSKKQPLRLCQLSVVLLILFYFTVFSFPFHMGEDKRKLTASQEPFTETSQENERLSRNLTSSTYRKFKVRLKG